MSEKLKPCPFCGSEDLNVYSYQNYYSLPYRWEVACTQCEGRGPVKNTKKQAIDAWDKRS